jgi:hypothetical protein
LKDNSKAGHEDAADVEAQRKVVQQAHRQPADLK